MHKGSLKKDKGFTIIEVVLVLAIAGLIFLIVFLALPQLQRSRRDTQRRSDTGRMLAALESYAGNNNGTYPAANSAAWGIFATSYLPVAEYTDPSNGPYGASGGTPIAFNNAALAATPPGAMVYGLGYTCGAGGALTSGGPRDAAIAMRLEQGVFCQDNR